ncbi:MAG TPA: BatA and WFA domain-containing protein [Gemmatimonadaceae bacterium]|nr:BatA and WFA domain-containing protein [Gemmatimonadaceae bacterium]
MSFLAPLLLGMAAAVAVPLLIHLWRRRIGTRVDFPAARYLARAEQEHSRKLRLRNLLLMLLRVAAVLFVVIAAARPVARVAGGAHAPTAMAIVLDNSLSTSVIIDGEPVLARLRAAALEILDRAEPTDRLWLLTPDGRTWGGSVQALRQAIDQLEPLGGAADPRGAVARAAGLARGAGFDASQIVVLTDGQATTWTEPVAIGDIPALVYAPAETAPVNRAVVGAVANPVRWTPRGAVDALVLSPDSVTYRITLEGRTLARGTAVGGGESGISPVQVRAAPPERGWIAGTVEIEPDELRADDVRHFAVRIGAPPRVSVHAAAGPFVRSAVDALTAADRLVKGGEIAIVPADALERLPAFILPPSDPVRLGAANRALERAGVPWRFGPLRTGAATARGGDLDGTNVNRRWELHATRPSTDDTVAVIGREPWIVAGDRYVILGSSVDPGSSALPVRASFVPWLFEMVSQRLTGEPHLVVEAHPGDSLRRPPWADALETPAGERVSLTGAAMRAPPRTGVYFLLRGSARSGAIVVNAEPDESRLARLSDDALRARLGGRTTRVIRTDEPWEGQVFTSTDRRSLLVPFLLAGCLAMLLETMVAGSAGRIARRGTT